MEGISAAPTTTSSGFRGSSDGMSLPSISSHPTMQTFSAELSLNRGIPSASSIIEDMPPSGAEFPITMGLQSNEFQSLNLPQITSYETIRTSDYVPPTSENAVDWNSYVPSFEDSEVSTISNPLRIEPRPLQQSEFGSLRPYVPNFERNDENGKNLTPLETKLPATEVEDIDKPVDLMQDHYQNEQTWGYGLPEVNIIQPDELEYKFPTDPEALKELTVSGETNDVRKEAIELLIEREDGDIQLRELAESSDQETAYIAQEALARQGINREAAGIFSSEYLAPEVAADALAEVELMHSEKVLSDRDVNTIVNQMTRQAIRTVDNPNIDIRLREEIRKRLCRLIKETKEILDIEALLIKEFESIIESEERKLELLHEATITIKIAPGTDAQMEDDKRIKEERIDRILDIHKINGIPLVRELDYVKDVRVKPLKKVNEAQMEVKNF